MKRNTSPLTSKDATTTKYHKFDNLFKKHKDLQDLLKKFNDFDSLKNNLTCSVCWDLLRPGEHGLEQCSNGHFLCNHCQDKLKIDHRVFDYPCPTCKIKFVPCRNLFATSYLEAFYNNTEVKCRHDGCTHEALLSNLLGHEDLGLLFFSRSNLSGQTKQPMHLERDHRWSSGSSLREKMCHCLCLS